MNIQQYTKTIDESVYNLYDSSNTHVASFFKVFHAEEHAINQEYESYRITLFRRITNETLISNKTLYLLNRRINPHV